jgi:hypothetical protein
MFIELLAIASAGLITSKPPRNNSKLIKEKINPPPVSKSILSWNMSQVTLSHIKYVCVCVCVIWNCAALRDVHNIDNGFVFTILDPCWSQWPRGLRSSTSSNARIVGSNPTQGMDVCVRLFCVLCVGSCLATGQSPVQGVLPPVYGLRSRKSGQCPQGL